MSVDGYGQVVTWMPERPRFHPLRLLVSWLLAAAALHVAAAIVPGVSVEGFRGALVTALLIAILCAIIPPIIAALRLPLIALLGFIIVLLADAAMLKLASDIDGSAISVDSFGWAIVAALVAVAVGVVLHIITGTNDDDTYTLKVIQRIAKRQGGGARGDVPGVVFLEIDGLALPVLRRAMRDGSAPVIARWLAEGSHRLAEWEPDLSSQTGASQAGILHGGLGGPQTRPFLLYPVELPAPEQPIVGAAEVHDVLTGWRRALQGDDAVPVTPTAAASAAV